MSKMKYFQSDFCIENIEQKNNVINDLLTKIYDNAETLNRDKECEN